ncbi:MAG: hypothetical protein Q8K97_07705 [Pseudohongiella sp.]|nr:hypothetical protein [Pseudohongiella sp.]MDP2127249.1 hypothetical protein [Pseudohongiella sp.]
MNAVAGLSTFVIVWFGLWVIPAAIVNSETRQFSGFFNRKTALYFVLMVLMNAGVVVPDAGLSGVSLTKVLVLSLLPFAAAYMMVRYYSSAR